LHSARSARGSRSAGSARSNSPSGPGTGIVIVSLHLPYRGRPDTGPATDATVVVYNPDPQRPLRSLFSWTHRLSGVGLIVFPLLAVARSTGDFKVHFYNILQA